VRSDLYITDWSALARAANYKCEIVAATCRVSERQLERLFLARFNQTPKQWMQALRMRTARELIERGYSTKAIADELHYKGSCQFCRAFKKYFGRSPQYFVRI
jgi:transcriptional regulator GlxA family with amidase domain